jgi:protein disulfide-isomerase A1
VFHGSVENPSEYQGGRQSEDIIKYMRKQNEPAYSKLASQADVDSFVNKDGVNIIGLFADEASDDEFVKVANALRNEYNFATATDSNLLTKHHSGSSLTTPSIILFKQEGNKLESVVFTGDVSSEGEISEFINAEAFPLVGTIGPENYQKYLDRGLNLVWFFYDLNNEDHKTALSQLQTVAAGFKGKVSIVKLDGVRWAEHAKHYGVPQGKTTYTSFHLLIFWVDALIFPSCFRF